MTKYLFWIFVAMGLRRPRSPENELPHAVGTISTTLRDLDGRSSRREWTSLVITVLSAVTSVVAVGVTAFLTSSALDESRRQTEVFQGQLKSAQDITDLKVSGLISVRLLADGFEVINRSSYPVMESGTWLTRTIRDGKGREFAGFLVTIRGVPACSAVTVSYASIRSGGGASPTEVEDSTWFEQFPWGDRQIGGFNGAFTFFSAPSGEVFSTSAESGIVDRGVKYAPGADVNYESYDPDAPWWNINNLVYVPDTYFEEFDTVELGWAESPIRAGRPTLGVDPAGRIRAEKCEP